MIYKINFYARFTNANGIELVYVKTDKVKKGVYNIEQFNSYHNHLKKFMRGFKSGADRLVSEPKEFLELF